MSSEKQTPMMRQFLELKRKHKDEILFFRMGDFYEMFLDDAIYASKVLDIALTKRQDKVPMCGIPYHALENYIHPILESGKNIAICEQIEDPKTVTGRIVKRDVTRVLTPGSIYEEELLHDSDQRQLATAIIEKSGLVTCTLADLSTGVLNINRLKHDEVNGYLESRNVKEVITDYNYNIEINLPIKMIQRDYAKNNLSTYADNIKNAMQITRLDLLELSEAELTTLSYLFLYVKEVAPGMQMNWQTPVKEYEQSTLYLDDAALKTLEILHDQAGNKNNSLFGILNHCQTNGGKRNLFDNLCKPSADLNEINRRYEAIELFLKNESITVSITEQLSYCGDLERVIGNLKNKPQVRHLGQVLLTLNAFKKISNLLTENQLTLPTKLALMWQSEHIAANTIRETLEDALYIEQLPPLIDERRFLKFGYSSTLDDIFELATSAQDILHKFEKEEREKYSIQTLRIKYNKVIGYFIEISKGQADKAPEHYIRRQTLVNGERYTTDELKNLEERILGAKDEILEINRSIFQTLVDEVLKVTLDLIKIAKILNETDVLISFAKASHLNGYVRPTLTSDGKLELKESRHPVVEAVFKEEVFVPNDVLLNNDNRHLAVLTGPNMSGKSTFIRQIGLIQVMCQAGCFVPANSASISIVDRVFTRIGAYDRLFKGESTFYVEMSECARIFQNFTSKSLILLDEVGRGTSTYDGISIARAMIEFLNNDNRGRPKTLFATHYAELAELIEPNRGILGLTVQIIEEKNKIVFLRKIKEGVADKSYGIYVAELAGLPKEITKRASNLLKELEDEGMWNTEPQMASQKTTIKTSSKKNIKLTINQPRLFD